jgi:hypothetical protein
MSRWGRIIVIDGKKKMMMMMVVVSETFPRETSPF